MFIKAAELGRVEILRKIYNSVTEHSRFALLTTKVYQAFVVASKNGRFAALMQLFNWCGSADQMNAAIEANGYSVFAAACKGGQLDTLMYLYNTCRGDSRQRMISSENFKSACESLEMGQPACFLLIYAHFSQKREMIQAAEKYIRSISSQEKRQHCQEVYESITLMLSLLDPSILSKPTQLTDRDILKFFKIYIEKGQLSELVSLYDSPATTVSLKKRAVEMEDYIAFKIATRRSDTTILRKLFEWTDERQRSLVLNSNNCECFVAAAEGNSLDILNTFLKYAGNDSQRQKLIQADSFKSFCLASENGHTAVMLVLYVYSTQRKEMLEAWESRRASLPPGKEKSIQTSVEYIAKVLLVMGNNVTLGNLDDESFCALFLDKIANNQPNELKSLYLSGNEAQQKKSLEQNNYRGFAMCADLGLLEILKILYDWANETQKIEMISSKQFEPFVLACVSGQRKIVEHFLVLTYLETEEGERGGKLLNSMLSARDALGFVSAAEKGRLDVLESIYSFVDDEVSRKLIKADDNKAFRLAGENGKTSVLMLLYLWSKNKSALLRSWDSYKDTFPPEKLDSVLVKKSIDFLGKLVKIKAPVPTATLSRRTNSSDIVGQFEAAIDYNQKDELVALRTLIGADRLKIVLEKDGAFTHFLNCVERDRLELLQQLYAWLEVPDGQKRALAMNDYLLFRTAVKAGYLDVVDEIVKWSVSYNLCGKMISSNNNEGFVLACEYGHLNVMGRIYDLSAGIEDKVYFKSFAAAANNGHTAALLLLYAWCGKRTDMVKQWEAQVRGMPAALMTKNVQTSTQFIKAVLTRLDSNTGGKSTGDTSAAATSSLLERRNEFSSGKSEAVEKSGGSNNIDEVPFTKRWKDAVSSGSVIETRNVWNNGLNDDQKKVLLQLDNYWAFQYSGLNGRLDMLDLIFHYGNSNQCMEMLASTSTFKDAASNGHIEVLRKILEWNNYDSLRIKLLTYNNCEVFCVAAENGYTEILNCLYEAAPTETIRSKFIEGGNYKAFCSAAENGMTSVLALMYVWSKDKVAIIRAWDAYRASMTPQKKKSVQVKNTDEYIAKFLKGKEGKHSIQRLYLETNTHLLPPGFKGSSTPPQEVLESMGLPTETISRALSKNPSSKPQGATKKFAATLKRQTNSADDYDGSDDNNKQSASQQPLSDELFIHRFKESVKQGSSSALKSLYKSATQAQKTRGIDFIWCSQQAAAGGFLDVLVQLWSWAGDDIVRASMLENKNYSIFKMAVTGGRVDMVEQLFVWWGNIGGKQVSNGARAYQVVLEADDYACFRTAAEMGLLELMARLYELAATDKVKRDMMAARDCEAYISALHKGHVVILNQLLVWADGSLRERFLNSRQILTFWAACEFDCLDLLKRVYEFASSEQQSLMVNTFTRNMDTFSPLLNILLLQ